MATTDLPRHRQRGEATRAAILAAARERFAADGYDRATIRAIAADVGVDPALVMRYYGNKEGIFAAAADIDLRLPDFGALPRSRIGTALVTHFLDRWEEDGAMQALLRTAATHPVAAEKMRALFARQVSPAIARLAEGSAATRAGLVATQLLGLALCRYVLEVPAVARQRRADLVKWIGPTVQRYITGKTPA